MAKKKKKKYKKAKYNPSGTDALMVVNPAGLKALAANPGGKKNYKKAKRNPFALGSPGKMVKKLVDKDTPIVLGGAGLGAFSSRYLTAKILKAKDVGLASVGVQSGLGLLGGVTLQAVLPRLALLGKFFFLGSVGHAGWRAFTTEVLSKNLVDGFQYGDILMKAPPKPAAEEAPAEAGPSGVYEEIPEEEVTIGNVGEAGFEEAY